MPLRTRVKFCGLVRRQDIDTAVALGVDAIGFVFYGPSKRYVEPEEAARLRRRLPSWVRAVGLFVNAPMDEVIATVDQVGLDVVQAHGDETPDDLRPLRARRIPYWKALRVGGTPEELRASSRVQDVVGEQVVPYTGAGSWADWNALLERGRVPADPVMLAHALMVASGAESCLLDSAGPGFGGSGAAFDWAVLDSMELVRARHEPDSPYTSLVSPDERFILAGGLTPDNVGEAIRRIHPLGVDVSSGIQGADAREKDAVRMAHFMEAVLRADAARLDG
ncbi:phosphoribosylanthranilate isomerase [Lautropia dentalis]|uniref:N-(5'-phosphoribosyl)anthranilate isomerase n=1 Tax=Lautropia dentalis TaxID=2490857 RepID=A0A426FRM3_9BURK|nr:phosphoribosylanthranilate isomerase [Lautropia dentalis]RRN45317.1 phosphoribosylanthranilate isomerase [Lautropia dentalis]